MNAQTVASKRQIEQEHLYLHVEAWEYLSSDYVTPVECKLFCVIAGSHWRDYYTSTPMWWKDGNTDGLCWNQRQADWNIMRWDNYMTAD